MFVRKMLEEAKKHKLKPKHATTSAVEFLLGGLDRLDRIRLDYMKNERK